MSDPHLRMCEIDLPAPIQDDAHAVAEIATRLVVEDVVKGKVSYLLFLTFTGTKAKLWQVHDIDANQADDILRAIAQRESAGALAVVRPTVVPPEVAADRAYSVTAEAASGVFENLVALKGGSGLGGQQFRIYGRAREDDSHKWLGHEPDGEVDIWVEGIVGAVIRGGEA